MLEKELVIDVHSLIYLTLINPNAYWMKTVQISIMQIKSVKVVKKISLDQKIS